MRYRGSVRYDTGDYDVVLVGGFCHPRNMRSWPAWWDWDLELSGHLMERMLLRDFTEIEVRHMLSIALLLRPDRITGRWIAECRWRRRTWEIIVEPDEIAQVLIVITAYPKDP